MLASIWEQVYGLIVEDGWIAVGAIAALAVSWLFARATGDNEALRDLTGPLLLVLIAALMLANLYGAGRSARRRQLSSRTQ